MSLELTPPESLRPEPLAPPTPVAAVSSTQADSMVKLDASTQDTLDAKVEQFVDVVVTSEVNSPPFVQKVQAIHHLGNDDIRAAANVSNRMLQRPVHSLSSGFFDDKSPVTRALLDLRKTVEDLDPARQGDLFAPKKIFGIFPAGDKVRDYFLRYQSAQSHIDAILQSLYHAQDELMKDNAALEEEKVNLWNTMGHLQQYIYVGRKIDNALSARIAELERGEPEKARVVKEEMLFSVRQKVQDLLTQLAVSIQGYLALDVVRKNNLELIKGVDRATTSTVSALRTAVIVAQALANQKLVLDQISALNATTGKMITSTSAMLRSQSAEVYQQASSASVSLETLQQAFKNIYETIDMISTYKLQALDTMQKTVDTLSAEVTKAKGHLDRVRSEQAAAAVSTVDTETAAAGTSGDTTATVNF
ncbi:MAG: toxic anion resistance protein [Caldilineaceae bacterium]|nr:toxic anion resistance protein [Caldilineaceae bacterium]